MNPDELVRLKTLTLSKLKLAGVRVLSPYILRNAVFSVDETVRMAYKELVLRLDSHVWGESKEKVHTIVEEPVFPSWKHHLIASLPEHSFRRRFLQYSWEIEGPLAKRVTHTVTAQAWRVFPANEYQYPSELGSAVTFVLLDEDNDYYMTEDPNDEEN